MRCHSCKLTLRNACSWRSFNGPKPSFRSFAFPVSPTSRTRSLLYTTSRLHSRQRLNLVVERCALLKLINCGTGGVHQRTSCVQRLTFHLQPSHLGIIFVYRDHNFCSLH